MFRFIFRDLLWGLICLACKAAWWIVRPAAMFLFRAHAIFFRNLFASKAGASGDPFAHMKPTRRDA